MDIVIENKPLSLIAALLYGKFYDEYDADDNDGIRRSNLNSFIFRSLNRDAFTSIGETFIGLNDGALVNYSKDHANLFNNTGKSILMSMIYEVYNAKHGDDVNTYIPEFAEINRGLILGLTKEMSDFSYRNMNLTLSKFSADGSKNKVFPFLSVAPYFEDGIGGLNHSQIFPIINSAIYYILTGTMFGLIGDEIKVREIFGYESDTAVDVDSLFKALPQDKILNISHLAMMFEIICDYTEKSTGVKFNDKFTAAFRTFGSAYMKKFNEANDGCDYSSCITSDAYDINTRAAMVVMDSLCPTSQRYVGDHTYDLRPMYFQHILRDTTYLPPMYARVQDEFNGAWADLEKYTSIMDLHAYERAMRTCLTYLESMNMTDDSAFVSNWYKYIHLDTLINNAFRCWSSSKSPFKIVGVDDLYVEVDSINDSTVKKCMSINSIQYSIGFERAITIAKALNARYIEAVEWIYCKKSRAQFNSDFYKKIDYVAEGFLAYDSVEDAIRDYKTLKQPRLTTIGDYSNSDLATYASKNNVDCGNKTIVKLCDLDTSYVDSDRSVVRYPFDIVRNGNFNNLILTNSNDSGKKFATTIKNLENAEFAFLMKQKD